VSIPARRKRRHSPDLARALNSLRRIVRAGRGATQAVESRFGISSAQLFVLQTLAESPGISIKELVAMTLTTNSSVSEVVGRLVASGLVTRDTAPDDRRRKVLALTEAGTEIVRHSPRTIQADLIDGFLRLSTKDQGALAEALDDWCRLSGFAEVPATMLFEPPTAAGESPPQKRRATAPASRKR
jgi:DNA-binding MarR family transcriptional regulator